MNIKKLLTHPNWSASTWFQMKNSRTMPDEEYIRKVYALNFLKRIDLAHPRTFNEKLNWLKLNLRDPLFNRMVDKYEVKSLVANKIGGGML